MIRKNERLLSLDVLRGGVLAGFIIQDNPGSKNHIYSSLLHAHWNGCTLADLGFPLFLFIVGVAMSFSLYKVLENNISKYSVYKKVLIRSVTLFILGLLVENFSLILNSFNHPNSAILFHFRIMGVLQRIAVTYLVASAIVIHFRKFKAVLLWAIMILVVYWVVMVKIPVPGYGAGDLSKVGNLATYVDNLLMPNHLWLQGNFDPEGLLSTISAIVTVLMGCLAGQLLRSKRTKLQKVKYLLIAGATAMILGLLSDQWFPINKSLWTSSYVLFTGGISILILTVFYWIIEVKGIINWTKPFQILGLNCLMVFLLSSLLSLLIRYIHIPLPGGSASIRLLFYYHIFQPLVNPELASLLYSMLYLGFWLLVMWYLNKKRMFITVVNGFQYKSQKATFI